MIFRGTCSCFNCAIISVAMSPYLETMFNNASMYSAVFND